MYLEDLNPGHRKGLENSGTYYFARVHASDKTWISEVTYSEDRQQIQDQVDQANARKTARGWPGSQYFVWPEDQPGSERS